MIVSNTGVSTVKGRNIVRDSRVTLVVQDELEDVGRWAARIGGRYMGADQAEAYGVRNGVPGELVVRVRQTKVWSARGGGLAHERRKPLNLLDLSIEHLYD